MIESHSKRKKKRVRYEEIEELFFFLDSIDRSSQLNSLILYKKSTLLILHVSVVGVASESRSRERRESEIERIAKPSEPKLQLLTDAYFYTDATAELSKGRPPAISGILIIFITHILRANHFIFHGLHSNLVLLLLLKKQ